MIHLCCLVGIAIGISIGLAATVHLLSKSNDIGNSKGTFKDFSAEPLRILSYKNKMRRPPI